MPLVVFLRGVNVGGHKAFQPSALASLRLFQLLLAAFEPLLQLVGVAGFVGQELAQVERGTPADLAATVFRHLGIDLNATWRDPQGRPIPIVTEGGQPIPELS